LPENSRLADRDRFLNSIHRRPALMGVLNVTPDSFSDGGQYMSLQAAVARAHEMAAQGAAILDIGGESTRPGHVPIDAAEELRRVLPVIAQIRREIALPLSIDTTKPDVARKAAEAGVEVINDIWGLQADPDMAHVVAETESAVVVMHNRAQIDAGLDIFDEFRRFFDRSLELAERAGIARGHILLDPGIGFGKTLEQNLASIWRLDRLAEYGLPVLLGLSRKSFIGKVVGASVDKRLTGTIASNMVGLMRGVAVLRVHDLAEHREALALFDALKGSSDD
jgi:dihydropteroate synthase